MVQESGTSNCPSCDRVVPASAAICPACGFRRGATTDAQVVLGLLRGDGAAPATPGAPASPPAPAPAPRPVPRDAAPTERIPLADLAAVRAGAGSGPGVPFAAPPAGGADGGDRLTVDSLFVRPDAPPAQAGPEPGPRRGLLDRLGDLPVPSLLPGGAGPRPGSAGPPGAGPSERPSRLPLLIALGLVVLILAGAAFAIAGLAGSLGSHTRRPAAQPAAASTVTLAPVDPATISAKASSTLHPESRGYQARNTLDGRDNTAWNSDGDKVGRGVGVTLTWTFDQAQDIRRITLRNGYVRSSKDAEVFRNNGRLKLVKVTGDGASTQLTLKDTADWQSLDVRLGPTRSVQVEVLEVYPGAKYKDLALTDIRFDAAG